MLHQVQSFCRICPVNCATIVTIENGRVVEIRGDKRSPVSNGYACSKGLQAPALHHGPDRLLHSLKRQADGSFARIPSEQAMDEIAEQLKVIRDRDGPDAIALYLGGGGMFATAALPIYRAFLQALGSPHFYSPATLDQPAKGIAIGRLGKWIPGPQDLTQADVVLLIGANPVVSQQALNLLINDPVRKLKAARASGLKLICIDPRRTETVGFADLHLQPYPGEDAAILGGLIRIILTEGWYDAEFCERYVGADRIADLRRAVEPFMPDMVERRAGLKLGQLMECAILFARDNRRGPAVMVTGGSFSPHANLAQHFVDTINILCGRLRRPGDRVWLDMYSPPGKIHAEVLPPMRLWEQAPKSRIRGIGSFYGEKLSPTLAEEILTPGKGQVKALITAGGNSVAVVPDQRKMVQAMEALELSVTLDLRMSATARLSDYVLAVRATYERPDFVFSYPGVLFQDSSYARYTPAVIDPPPGSDVIDDWYFYWSIARRLGLQIVYDGVPLDMETAPTTDALLALRTRNSRVTWEQLHQYPLGKVFDEHPDNIVAPGRPGQNARFDVMPDDVAQEVRDYLAAEREIGLTDDEFPLLLCNRRSRYVFNSALGELSEVKSRSPFGKTYIHPDDMRSFGLEHGDEITISSRHGRIAGVAVSDAGMKPGVMSMIHAADDFADQDGMGSNVNALIDAEEGCSSINALPVMSAIRVNIRRREK